MANININNTSYNVMEDWLKVAANYFNIDQSDANSVNLLKAGLFGYNNEIQSNEIKNNVYHRNILYDEHFVNTASFPESIHNFARLYDVPIDMATPSHINVAMMISKNDILNSPYIESEELETETGQKYTNQKLVLDNNYTFSIENIHFRLPYPIRFDIRKILGGYNINAKYVVDYSNPFPFMNVQSPYIKTWIDDVGGEEFVVINIDLYQLMVEETNILVTSNNILDNMYIERDFSNQLAYIEMYYTENGVTERIEVDQNDRII